MCVSVNKAFVHRQGNRQPVTELSHLVLGQRSSGSWVQLEHPDVPPLQEEPLAVWWIHGIWAREWCCLRRRYPFHKWDSRSVCLLPHLLCFALVGSCLRREMITLVYSWEYYWVFTTLAGMARPTGIGYMLLDGFSSGEVNLSFLCLRDFWKQSRFSFRESSFQVHRLKYCSYLRLSVPHGEVHICAAQWLVPGT